jgi:hypothetical protein
MTLRLPLRPLVVATLLLGCRRAAPSASPAAGAPLVPAVPTGAQRWEATRRQVESLVAEGRIAGADSALVAHLRATSDSEAIAAVRWRVLLRLEPRAAGGDLGPAVTLLDSLLADTAAHRALRPEATLLRRGLAAADSLRRLEGRRRQQATQQAGDRADELRTTRDSLQKLAAEIERLKRRLRAP